MKGNTNASLSDRTWAKQSELGTLKEVIEYTGTDGIKRSVDVEVHRLSGEEMESLEALCSTMDEKAEKITIDKEKFSRLRICRMFNIDEDTLTDIYKNKPAELRTKMLVLSAEVSGERITQKEIDQEKK